MSNAMFDPGREGVVDGTISLSVAVIKVALVSGYTFSAAHKFMSDIVGAGGGTIQGTPQTLASKTFTNGVFDAADPSFTAVPTAPACKLVYYQASAVTGGSDVANTAQRVLCVFDTGTNLPVTPNGGDINVAHDNGANKILKL
jgi:hypothetical protein